MARARSSDIPSFDTYPAPTPSEAQSTPQDWPYEPKSDEYRPGNERLNRKAEQVGASVGRAVRAAKDMRERFGGIRDRQGRPGMTEELKEKVAEVAGQARGKIEDLRESASEQFDELSVRARDAAARARVRVRVNEAREHAQRYARENPLHVIAGALLAGILLGIGLRVWRSSDE
jgi:ElaB/YqjD/DUF883 family membrane-anchored ribosome-binding protein